ncbi:DUF357 domain-containing protein [Candidatus Woesearchaeota archaeon]|nr:DUF357 domain-containing protein [Candidatus Woesearchaeota archaeon]
MNTITDEKLEKYFAVTRTALKKARHSIPEKTHLRTAAEDFLDMTTRYLQDAEHFAKKGDFVTAFAALNYAHGWLDAGARLGLFDVGHDSELFTVD